MLIQPWLEECCCDEAHEGFSDVCHGLSMFASFSGVWNPRMG